MHRFITAGRNGSAIMPGRFPDVQPEGLFCTFRKKVRNAYSKFMDNMDKSAIRKQLGVEGGLGIPKVMELLRKRPQGVKFVAEVLLDDRAPAPSRANAIRTIAMRMLNDGIKPPIKVLAKALDDSSEVVRMLATDTLRVCSMKSYDISPAKAKLHALKRNDPSKAIRELAAEALLFMHPHNSERQQK